MHGGASLLLFFRYRSLISTLQKWLPTSRRHPLLNNALALGVAWLVVSGLGVASLTGLGVWASSGLTGEPIC